MPRRLLVVNVAFVAVALVAIGLIVRDITQPPPKPTPVRARTTAPPAAPSRPAEPPAPRPPASAYGVIASRNLFSPTRSEAPAGAAGLRPAVALPKPLLYGVVLRDGTPIAYLEDPTTKRVAGYRLGDAVAGGTVQTIEADRVVLNRPEGPVDVRLRDPGKPRPAAPPTVPGTVPTPGLVPPLPGGAPLAPGTAIAPQPGVPPLPQFPQFPTIQPPAVQQPIIQPGQIPTPIAPPVRRSLPPSLLRRVPPGSPNDAAPQN